MRLGTNGQESRSHNILLVEVEVLGVGGVSDRHGEVGPSGGRGMSWLLEDSATSKVNGQRVKAKEGQDVCAWPTWKVCGHEAY